MEHLLFGGSMIRNGNINMSSSSAAASIPFPIFSPQQLLLSSAAAAQQAQKLHQQQIQVQQQQQHDSSQTRNPTSRIATGTVGNGDLCAVCSDAAQGIHFGVVVCRACAAFFRRSTIAKRVYRCRFDGNCPIEQREIRCSCRACRLAKCLALGMDPNVVQKHRDQIWPRKSDKNSAEKRQWDAEENGDDTDEQLETKTHINSATKSSLSMCLEQSVHPSLSSIKNSNNNDRHLLPPLTLMAGAFQRQFSNKEAANIVKLEVEDEKEERKSMPTASSHQPLFHYEDGKSYALLGTSTRQIMTSSLMDSPHQQQQQQQLMAQQQPKSSLSDLLFRALPSAFSPIQPANSQSADAVHQQSDSGNASASSSVFSSPLNPAITGAQNSPLNAIIGICTGAPVTTLSAGPSTSNGTAISPAVVPADAQKPLLAEMLRGYRKFLALRRNVQHLQAQQCPFQTMGEELKAAVFEEGTYKEHVNSIKSDMSLLSEMLDEHFQPLRTQFSSHSKWSMLRNFFCTFIIAERCYSSTLLFPGQEDTRIICSSGSYLDVRRLDRYFAVEQCRTDPSDIARVFEPVFTHFQHMIRRPMDRLAFSELEFIGLIGLLFWNHRIDALTEEERRTASQTRERIFAELSQQCRVNGRDLTGQRYCTLVNLFNIIQRAALEIASAFSLVNVVQKFEVDEFLHQFHPLTF